MKKKYIPIIALCAMSAWTLPAVAQGVLSENPTAAKGVPDLSLEVAPSQQNRLQQGTPVSLRLLRELSTKHKALKAGDRFDLELVDPLKLGTATVIPAGTRAVGEIMSARNKGMWGKSGHFSARLMFLRVGERMIRLGGTFDDKGVAGGWGAAATSVIVIPVAGFFMTGTSAKIEAGTIVKGYLDEDVPVATAAVVSTPPLMAAPAPHAQPSN